MDARQAANIVKKLADGQHPSTDQPLEGTVFQETDIVRALYVALACLERAAIQRNSTRERPRNQGKPWTAADESLLLQKFDEGMKPADLAELLGRTPAGITARLEQNNRINEKSWQRNS